MANYNIVLLTYLLQFSVIPYRLSAGLKGAGGPGHRPFTKPFIFYFSLIIDAYETTTEFVAHC